MEGLTTRVLRFINTNFYGDSEKNKSSEISKRVSELSVLIPQPIKPEFPFECFDSDFSVWYC